MTSESSLEQCRTEVYDALADAMIEGLENGQLTVEGSQQFAGDVKRHLEGADSLREINLVIQLLRERYPNIRGITKGRDIVTLYMGRELQKRGRL